MVSIDPNDPKWQEVSVTGGDATKALKEIFNEGLALVTPELGGDTSVDFVMGASTYKTPEEYQEAIVKFLEKLRDVVIPQIERVDTKISANVVGNDAYNSMMGALMGDKLSDDEKRLAEEQFQSMSNVAMKPAEAVRQENLAPLTSMHIDDFFDF